jgi:hypothetical protein
MHQKTPVNKLEQDEIGQDDQSCNFRIQSTKRRSKLHVILGMACHWYAIGMPLVCHLHGTAMPNLCSTVCLPKMQYKGRSSCSNEIHAIIPGVFCWAEQVQASLHHGHVH